jgi:uncharacterized protein (UPF0332 family)
MAEQEFRESIYLEKALESLAGATSEYSNRRFNNCANRAYYACFQGAVAVLRAAGFRPTGSQDTWSHATLHATFARELITRRKVYPADDRDVLARTYTLRQSADYSQDLVSDSQAERVLRRAGDFLAHIQTRGGGRR